MHSVSYLILSTPAPKDVVSATLSSKVTLMCVQIFVRALRTRIVFVAEMLLYFAQSNHLEICELLLNFGADLEQKFKGATSLQIATQLKHTKVIKLFYKLRLLRRRNWETKMKLRMK